MSMNETICEVDGELITSNHIKADHFLDQQPDLPQVHFTLETFKRSALNEGPAESAFLERNETFQEKLLSAWRSQGFSGVLSEFSNSTESDQVPCGIKKWCTYLLLLSRWVSSMQVSVFPHLKLSDQELAAEFSPNNDWKESCVRLLSWHPHANKFALALIDDTIRIYYNDNALVPLLKHKKQRNVVAIEWKPYCSSILAVASHTCILIWNVDPVSLSTRPSSGSIQVLSYPAHSPVTSIAWSTYGFDMLFSCSALDSSIVVWDVSLSTPTIVHKVTTSGGVSKLMLSPEGSKMLVATPTSSFRVYETATWTNERWTNLEGRVQAACWTPKGTTLLFGVKNGSRIYSISFASSTNDMKPVIDGSKNASIAIELSHRLIDENEEENSSNLIHSMIMNKTGERLAILFGKEHASTSAVALFTTSEDPVFTATPRGYVNGPDGSVPSFITFKPFFEDGATLTMCTKDGQVLHIPLFFNNRSIKKRLHKNPDHSLNTSSQQFFLDSSTIQTFTTGHSFAIQ